MGDFRFKKYLTAAMAAAMLAVPPLQASADDSGKGILKGADGKASIADLQGMNAKASKGKHVITLITGDVVTVTEFADGKNIIHVEPADPSASGARILTANKETYVIPDKAMPYLASGFLDQDLFNITALIKDGYDDENQKELPVIIQYSESKGRSAAAIKAPKGSKKTHVLESIDSVAVSADKKETKEFWSEITSKTAKKTKASLTPGIEKIWLDGRVEASLEQSVPQIGAPAAWESGYDGTGVKVAVLDTGIDSGHPDISGQLDEAVSFVPGEEVTDRHAHGTHVASTVLGTGEASEGRNKGVAPGARLLVGKVLSDEGFGQDSWIIDGMEWAAENAKVVNMSLGSSEPSDGTDPMAQAVNNLSKETGSLFVIAAGNTGSEGIGSPGAAEDALTVGAVDKSDNLAWFSSKGPSFGSSGLKPDLTAPGVGILAARSQYTNQGSGSYMSMDGTSMATPHVAGAAALLAQRYPDWTGEQLKEALMSTTKKLEHIKPFEGGTGRLDAVAALGHTRATGSLDFGFYDWPHENDGPAEKTLTYTNDGDQDITLDLTVSVKDANDTDAPSGMVKLSAEKVTVPAKGSTDVTVTLDPNAGDFGNRYQGHISASSEGESIVHTSLGMIKEDERYPLTIKAIDRDGEAASAYFYLLGPTGEPQFMSVEGTKELRLPKGIYSVMSMMDVDTDTDHAGVALVGDPEVNLDGPQTVMLDAREANEITVDVPKETEAHYRKMEYFRSIDGNQVNDIYIMPAVVDKMYAAPTEKVDTGEFTQATRWRLAEPLLTIGFKGKELDDIPQAGSTLMNGKYNLEAVYAGNGSHEDYQKLDVKGKAAIVLRSDELTGSERAAAALAAGAKLLITVNDRPQELSEWTGVEIEDFSLSDSPLPVAGVSGNEGQELIEAAKSGGLTLKVEGTPDSDYLYDLVDMHHQAVPQKVNYSPKTKDLVKINSKYKSDRPAPGAEFRYDILEHSFAGVGFLQRLSLPSVRTEWVSAQNGTSWYHQAGVLDAQWEVRQPKVSYKPGQTLNEEWFSPVIRPRFGDGFWAPYRSGNYLILNVPAWADSGAGHTGADMNYPGDQTLKLYQGDTLVREGKGQALYLFNEFPAEKTQYKLISDAARDAERWNTSVRTHTEWTFWSQQQGEYQTALPLISLDYKVDTDMAGNSTAGKKIKLDLSAVQIADAPENGKIKGASLEVSFDEGKTWEAAKLAATGNGWSAEIKHPNKKGASVSLRASAWDDAGNRVTQEIIKAYGLK
ncbi:S8 family serine peptidase [Cytobacillus oceanisediminis]|uniref:S8 family serine peptidase n=1 Tax=Cytobacillus oceanisediminis TaxID=665099 RepID=UPI001D147C0F|nr:S8 family serine peptidase [Cytobacillus oceanisediminis]MCC3648192.1 S8 family serine peptidase [Cytobacillus oceanisediminis]